MKSLRSAIFWVHLAVGAAAGLVVLIMSVTGVALTYEKQMLEWADRRAASLARATRHEAPAAALPPGTLFAMAAKAVPGKAPIGLTLRAEAAAPATMTFEGNAVRLINPYTGAIVGEPPAALRSFFRTMTVWHRYLALEGASRRATGKMMTGAANLGFLFLVVSGLYLWFPRVWTRLQFKNVLWFRRGVAPKARHFNWHNAIGFWSAVPLAIVVAGALPISYPWASNLVYRLAGDTPPPVAAAPARPAQQPAPAYYAHGVDASWAAAIVAVPEWRTITTRLATNEKAPIVITVDAGYAGQPQKRRTLTFDRATAAIAKDEAFESLSAGRRARSWLRFAHTGEFYGLTGQTIAGIASLGGAFLVYTGLSLALRRLAAWLKRRRDGAAPLERPRAA